METIFLCQPATSPSWVTVTIVVLKSRLSSKSKFIHFLLLSTSKDAVGSSHKINLGQRQASLFVLRIFHEKISTIVTHNNKSKNITAIRDSQSISIRPKRPNVENEESFLNQLPYLEKLVRIKRRAAQYR